MVFIWYIFNQLGKCKLCDFGVVNKIEGRPNFKISKYTAPEIKDNKQTTFADVWSFGVILVEMILGDVSSDIAENVKKAVKQWPEMKPVIESALEVDPLKRSQPRELLKHFAYTSLSEAELSLINVPLDPRVYHRGIVNPHFQKNGETKRSKIKNDYCKAISLKKGSGYGELKRPECISIDKAGNLVIGEFHNSKIVVCKKTGEYVHEFNTTIQPQCVAVDLLSGNICCCDFEDIYVFSEEGAFLWSSKGSDEFSPSGVCYDDKGNIVATDKKNMRIINIDQEYNVKTDFDLEKSPRGIDYFSSKKYVTIANSDSNGVYMYSKNGDCMSSYKMKAPSTVCVDGEGKVIVCENTTIVILDPMLSKVLGKFTCTEGTPTSVAVDENGNIIYTCSGGVAILHTNT